MAELKPSTKIERIIARMRPLADWYAKNKPDVDTIRLPPEDLKILSDHAQDAMAQGIFVDSEGLKWKDFYLKSA
ncbi:MAG TPA: hypothetical protein VIW26_16690 [Gemmatimonadales bacterium]